jgi:hypothetical protein
MAMTVGTSQTLLVNVTKHRLKLKLLLNCLSINMKMTQTPPVAVEHCGSI